MKGISSFFVLLEQRCVFSVCMDGKTTEWIQPKFVTHILLKFKNMIGILGLNSIVTE